MLKNYFKIALRSFYRQKFYAIINLSGLTIGLATSLLITLYIYDEFSFDRFHENIDDMYRVNLKARLSDQDMNSGYTSAPLGAAFVDEIPEVTSNCRIAMWNDINIRYQDDTYTEQKVLVADSNFFDFFNFKLLEGNPKDILTGPNKIVLTETSAMKLFGYPQNDNTSPLGKIIQYGIDGQAAVITGIAADSPHNSHFRFNMVVSMDSWDRSKNSTWVNNILINYVRLNKNAVLDQVQAKLPGMVDKYIAPMVQAILGISFDDFIKNGGIYEYFLQPVKDIHLYSGMDRELEPGGSINTIYILTAIVLFILIIACINFMNLSTARFSQRAKEVGVRKTLGASRKKLILQFFNESLIFSFVAMFLAILIIWIILPQFNTISGKQLDFSTLLSIQSMISIVMIAALVGLLAGAYPAFYLTAFRPTEVLRGKVKAGLKSGGIRSALVVFQFSISIVLIISTLLINKQLNHLGSRNLGFNKENVMVIKNANALEHNKISFKEELKKMSGIKNVSISSQAPPSIIYSDVFQPQDGTDSDVGITYCFADNDFIATMDMQMAGGRYFSDDVPSDSSAVIINEAAAKMMAWDNPVGEKLGTLFAEDHKDLRNIVGVVKDFNFQTLKKEVTALVIFPGTDGNLLLARISSDNYKNQVSEIESAWKSMVSDVPFEFSFIDSEFDALFTTEQRLSSIIFIFTALAILVACLGLLGLATFTTEQRSKEIGIRKSMGASSGIIVGLLSKEYIKLILISFVVAAPVSYTIIKWWLNNFAYKVDIGVMSFIIGGVITLTIALLSVSYQSVKAALRNPVKSLRYE